MFQRLVRFALVPLALCGVAAIAPAQTVALLARINAGQEVPTNTSTATGLCFVAIDTSTGILTYREVYSGLSSTETAAHFHGFAPAGVNAGVVNGVPLGTLKCGQWVMTPAQQVNVLAGLSYANIHSISFPGGEIRGQVDIAPDQPTFCYGDGSGAACPCSNFSPIGYNEGCLHSGGMGARLVGYAGPAPSPSISNDRLVLHLLRAPQTTAVLLYQGTTQVAGGAGVAFGEGIRCVGGNIVRLGVRNTCIGQLGMPEPADLPISVAGFVTTPGVRYYQAWYRVGPPLCTTTPFFNLSNGVQVTWVP